MATTSDTIVLVRIGAEMLFDFWVLVIAFFMLSVVAVSTIIYRHRRSRRRLVAVLGVNFLLGILVALVYTTVFSVGSPSEIQITPIPAGATAAPTNTPIPFVRLVVAQRELPRGFRFPASIQQLYDYVYYDMWPENTAPFNGLYESQGGLEQVVGKIVRADISREEPILSSMLVDDYNQIANLGTIPTVSPLLRGSLTIDKPVNGEINNQTWMEDWEFVGGAGETYSFRMVTTGGDLRPFLLAWSDGDWVDGQWTFDGQITTLTVTLPITGYYRITATRTRTNNGRTAGTYQLSAATGYLRRN